MYLSFLILSPLILRGHPVALAVFRTGVNSNPALWFWLTQILVRCLEQCLVASITLTQQPFWCTASGRRSRSSLGASNYAIAAA